MQHKIHDKNNQVAARCLPPPTTSTISSCASTRSQQITAIAHNSSSRPRSTPSTASKPPYRAATTTKVPTKAVHWHHPTRQSHRQCRRIYHHMAFQRLLSQQLATQDANFHTRDATRRGRRERNRRWKNSSERMLWLFELRMCTRQIRSCRIQDISW